MKKQSTTIKGLLPQGPNPNLKMVTVRCTPEEYATLKKKAEKYARGNMTGYVKYLILNVEPRAEDLA